MPPERTTAETTTTFSSAHPRMKPLHMAQHALRRVRLLPVAGGVLVRLGERRVDVDGAEDLVQADAVLHRGDELDDHLGGVLADDGGAEDAIAPRRSEHLD